MTPEPPALLAALPYIDTAIDDDDAQREGAMKLVDDEMVEFPPEKDYLSYLAGPSMRPFLTETLEIELQALDRGDPRPNLEGLSRIQVCTPPVDNPNPNEEDTNLWTKSLNQIRIKLEYMQRQKTNLELLKTYGVSAWEQYIAGNERMEHNMKQEIEELGAQIRELNSLRKSHQQQISRHLEVLQTHWDSLSVGNRLLAEEIARTKAR